MCSEAPNTVLITGGAGYIGSVLYQVWRYTFPKSRIIIYDNLMYRQESIAPFCYDKNLELVCGDVRNESALKQYLDMADIVIPLAAIVGAPACRMNPQLATDVIYGQVRFITRNASKHQKIVLPNTNSGYGVNEDGVCTEKSPLKPISHYGIEKVRAEQCLLDSGNGVSLRLATVFGVSPRMRIDLLVNDFTYKAVRDGYIVLFEKDFKRNYIHVRDVASAFIFVIRNYNKTSGQIYNIGLSDANLSKWELCQKIKEYVPNFSIQVDEFAVDPDQRNYIVSNDKIESMGWKPDYSLDDGIQELIKAYCLLLHSDRKFTNL